MMNGEVVVIGGGTAGMEAAGQLAKIGYKVTLLEKEAETGGHVKNWYHLFPDRKAGSEVIKYLVRFFCFGMGFLCRIVYILKQVFSCSPALYLNEFRRAEERSH